MLDLFPRNVLEMLRQRFGRQFNELNDLECLILSSAAIEGFVSHPRLLEMSTDHPHDVTLALQRLVKNEFLLSSGHGRGAVYHIQGVKVATPDEVFAGRAALEDLKGSNQRSEGLIAEGLDMPIIHKLADLKPELLTELQELAGIARSNRRLHKEEMTTTVIKLCQRRYLTLKVLGELLGRSEDYLRLKVLNPLVEKRILRRAFPATPNDPRQAYTASTVKAE